MSGAAPYCEMKPGLSARARAALWVILVAALGVTFAAYGQIALMLQWVTLRLC